VSQRILSISGLRGIIGDGLDPLFLTEFAAAFGTWCEGKTVVLSRDGRLTGTMVQHAVLAGLTATGCRVLDAGIAATPTCGVLTAHHGAAGGLQITASHNPIEWNGLKLFGPDGAVLGAAQGRQLLDLLNNRAFSFRKWDGLGEVAPLPDAGAVHRERVLSQVDADAVRTRRFRVVLDCNHGSGAVLGPKLLQALACDVHVLGGTPDGRFDHPPEPLEENLTTLCDAVRENDAALGFAQDPDADRLAVVDETGRYISEELTLALCADHILSTRKGPVVINASTSRATADVADRHGCAVHRSSVGEANVVARMREVDAVLGGEGNGGVIEPNVGWVRDSFIGMAGILEGLARRRGLLSDWVATIPKYTIVKDKLSCPREAVPAAVAALRKAFPDATAEENDGLRLDWSDRWVQVRASNTEPIVRIIAEAPAEAAARELCGKARKIVARTMDD